jgi:hypothetical protein
MRSILRGLAFILDKISKHGWLILVAMFYPVYWSQDCAEKNRGYDTLSLRCSGYDRMTVWKAFPRSNT